MTSCNTLAEYRQRRAETSTPSARVHRPRVDIHETEQETRILADMPGTDESSIEVTLDGGILTLRGEISLPEGDATTCAWSEFEGGAYERSFALSEDLARGEVRAEVRHGVLEIVLTAAREEPRRIEIRG